MPYRTQEILEQWLREFVPTRQAGAPARVVLQDGPVGTDTGLVVVPLVNATTSVYIEPCRTGESHWTVTFEPRYDELHLQCGQVATLAAELLDTAELCSYLEERSIAYVAALTERSPDADVMTEADLSA